MNPSDTLIDFLDLFVPNEEMNPYVGNIINVISSFQHMFPPFIE